MRWTLTAISTAWADTTKSLGLTTDIPTHLWLLWSLIPPKRFVDYPERRGTYCRIGEFLWPWPLNSLEQNEGGLTVAKSFTWGPWPEGQTRYYCFYPDPTAQTGHSTSPVFQQTAPEVPPTVFNSDRFYTNFTPDGAPGPHWDIGFWHAADPVQSVSRLRCPNFNLNRQEGVVSVDPAILSTSITQIRNRMLACNYTCMTIAATKTLDTNPFYLPDAYTIYLDKVTGEYVVQRSVAGVMTWLYAQPWDSQQQTHAIEIIGGDIHFYERGILRFSEAYQLPTYNLYTYLYNWSTGMGLGIDYFEDFLQHRAWPT